MHSTDKLSKCYITVNRACNLACKWCYAMDTGFSKADDMKEETFDSIVNFLKTTKIKKITLIGGEPTLFPSLFDFAKKISNYSITIVSNGIAYSNIDFCKRSIESGINNYCISIKAANSIKYKELTGKNFLSRAINGIKNLVSLNASVTVSFVITRDNIDDLECMIKMIRKKTGCDSFFVSFCRNYCNDQNDNSSSLLDSLYVARKFENLLPNIRKITKNFHYNISDPLCFFSKNFLDRNIQNFYFPCYVHSNTAITFDTNGATIPCNTIHDYQYGIVGIDFNTCLEYSNVLKREQNRQYLKKIKGYPSHECIKCEYYINCQGRCVCNWTNYSYSMINKSLIDMFVMENEELKPLFDKYKESLFKILNHNNDANFENDSNIGYTLIIGETPYKNRGNSHPNEFKYNSNLTFNMYTTISNGSVAFIPSNYTIPQSAVTVLAFLFNSIDFSNLCLNFFTYINRQDVLISYLLSRKVLLLNYACIDFASLSNINIDKVLLTGKLKCNQIASYCINNNIPCVNVIHPSSKNRHYPKYSKVWYYHNDSEINKNKNFNFKNPKLKDFIIEV